MSVGGPQRSIGEWDRLLDDPERVHGLMIFVDSGMDGAMLTYLGEVIAKLPRVRQVHSLRFVNPDVIKASLASPPIASGAL